MGYQDVLSAVLALVLGLSLAQATTFIIGQQGQSCSDACYVQGMNCNPNIRTDNSTLLFQKLGIQCIPDARSWWAEDQPCYVSDPNDPNYGRCLGFIDVPGGVQCGGMYPASRRLCACEDPDSYSQVAAFGTGLSNSFVDTTERVIFNWIVPQGMYGVMNHLWATAQHPILEDTLIRYYIDGEANASLQFYLPMACGTGFDDQFNPWGTQWIGKGAADGSWFNNLRIPFGKSIRITVQKGKGVGRGFYMIVRGLPLYYPQPVLSTHGLEVPPNARMNLVVFNKTVAPLEWVPLVDMPHGRGILFMHTLAIRSGNMNFLEGCYHAYTPYKQGFPGTLLSTGTEDYFDSGWYFNGGQFRMPVSGFTHLAQGNGSLTWSAYRFHEMDPLPFSDGFRFVWRNGDTYDAAGQKCYMETGGSPVGSPTASQVLAYTWIYTWSS